MIISMVKETKGALDALEMELTEIVRILAGGNKTGENKGSEQPIECLAEYVHDNLKRVEVCVGLAHRIRKALEGDCERDEIPNSCGSVRKC